MSIELPKTLRVVAMVVFDINTEEYPDLFSVDSMLDDIEENTALVAVRGNHNIEGRIVSAICTTDIDYNKQV